MQHTQNRFNIACHPQTVPIHIIIAGKCNNLVTLHLNHMYCTSFRMHTHACTHMHAHTHTHTHIHTRTQRERRIERQVTSFKERVHSCSLQLNHTLIHMITVSLTLLVYVALSDHVSFLICGWTSVRSLAKLKQRLAPAVRIRTHARVVRE